MFFESGRERSFRRQQEWDEYRAKSISHYDRLENERIHREQGAIYDRNVAAGQGWKNHLKVIVPLAALALFFSVGVVLTLALMLGVVLKTFLPVGVALGAVLMVQRRRRALPWTRLDQALASGVLLGVPWVLGMLVHSFSPSVASVLMAFLVVGVMALGMWVLPLERWVSSRIRPQSSSVAMPAAMSPEATAPHLPPVDPSSLGPVSET